MLIVYYLSLINVITFFIFGLDKLKAVRSSHSRFPERLLLGLSLLGGIVGGLLGMLLFRHKVSKSPFKVRMYVILFLYLVGSAFLIHRIGMI